MAITLRNTPRSLKLSIAGALVLVVLVQLFLCWRWSREPALYLDELTSDESPAVSGYLTVSTLVGTIDWLLEKPGGYLSNDIYTPSVWLDNMPSFEFGVLMQARDLTRVLRNNYSRSQSQSTEHSELTIATTALDYTNDQWVFPSTQRKFREAQAALMAYRSGLANPENSESQFYASASNLNDWLALVERRLGNLSQQLSASVGQTRVNPSLPSAPVIETSSLEDGGIVEKTRWTELDDVFFQTRGSAWALLQFLAAAQVDFNGVLTDKNAVVSLEQVMRELEGALAPLGSPIILNGNGYGLFANHSLVLASYIARAHSAVIDLRALLARA